MSRLPLVSSRRFIRVMELIGFEFVRQKGSHAILAHPDGRTLSVPERRQLRIGPSAL